jgi:hypothetical protein
MIVYDGNKESRKVFSWSPATLSVIVVLVSKDSGVVEVSEMDIRFDY